jgi:diadenosine tetraphosphate (Ap4A) HIT family hydrolase
MTTVQQGIESARSGTHPGLICRVSSGWAVLCDMQYLRGWTILLPDSPVKSLNDLEPQKRAGYLCDMALVGDALLEVTGAYRINYAIFGNSDPALHAHIVPRFMSEPEQQRMGPPWSYPKEIMDAQKLNPERDRDLMRQIAAAIRKRLAIAH